MYVYDHVMTLLYLQPDNPAQLGWKIYEMMDMALSGKWLPAAEFQSASVRSQTPGTLEAEIVEPVEAGSQK